VESVVLSVSVVKLLEFTKGLTQKEKLSKVVWAGRLKPGWFLEW
jgi:hypothetical protein